MVKTIFEKFFSQQSVTENPGLIGVFLVPGFGGNIQDCQKIYKYNIFNFFPRPIRPSNEVLEKLHS
jgi:hypothetical protein